jgi:hypothetical protein
MVPGPIAWEEEAIITVEPDIAVVKLGRLRKAAGASPLPLRGGKTLPRAASTPWPPGFP